MADSGAVAHLRDLAARLAATWRGHAGVTLLVGGSTASGHADRYSDLDLFVVTREALAPELRHRWLDQVADPGTAVFVDQPVRTGGLADTFLAAGTSVTVCYRRLATVEAGLAALRGHGPVDRDGEAAYGHELTTAIPLLDPQGLAAAWRDTALAYPATLRERIEAAARAWFASPPRLPDGDLYPAAAWLVHLAAARAGQYYGGPKRIPLDQPLAAAAFSALVAEGAPEPRWQALAAWVEPGQPAGAEAAGETPRLQVLNAGADAVGGRLLVATLRGQVGAFAWYLHKSGEAWRRLGGPPEPYRAAWAQGCSPGRMDATRRRLLAVWADRLEAWRRQAPGDDLRYAEAALAAGRAGPSRTA